MEKPESTPTPVTNVQNYIRLHRLLNCVALPLLRKMFMDNWLIKFQRAWETSAEQGEQFVDFIGVTAFGEAGRIKQKIIKTGDIQKWNISMTVDALKFFKKDTQLCQEHHSNFDKLNDLFDQICLHGGSNIDDQLFEQMWATSSEALLYLGASATDLEQAKEVSLEPEEE